MKKILTSICTVLIFITVTNSQPKIDSTYKLKESTFYDGDSNTVFRTGLVIRTRSGNFYQITDNASFKNATRNPSVKVYKQGEKKYQLVIKGIDIPIAAKIIDVAFETNVNGIFKGWNGNSQFKLLNGETWQQWQGEESLYTYLLQPKVIIYRDELEYKMQVEGINKTIRVVKISKPIQIVHGVAIAYEAGW